MWIQHYLADIWHDHYNLWRTRYWVPWELYLRLHIGKLCNIVILNSAWVFLWLTVYTLRLVRLVYSSLSEWDLVCVGGGRASLFLQSADLAATDPTKRLVIIELKVISVTRINRALSVRGRLTRMKWLISHKVKQEAQLLLGDRAPRKHAKDCWNGRGNDNQGWNDLQVYFKVIKSGTNRMLVYDFLLVV